MGRLEDKLTVEMLPTGVYQEIAREIGVENLLRLSKIVGGSTFYCPKLESLLKPARDQAIRDEYNGYNQAELASKYGVTTRWVRSICGEEDVPGQMSLYDMPNGLKNE